MAVTIRLPVPGGHHDQRIELGGLVNFLEHAEARIAGFHGVAVEDYRGWLADHMNVRCVHVNQNGDQCRRIVAGGHALYPAQWVEMHGSFCELHTRKRDLHRV